LRGDERAAAPVLVAELHQDTGDKVVSEQDSLVLWHHLTLHDWHVQVGALPDERADRTARGYVAQHQGKWWLVNTSEVPWYIVDGDTDVLVGRNASVECIVGRRVRIGNARPARVLRFDALR
jgi:hypothetical protein